MGIGTVILLGLIVGEVAALVKISRQNKRIHKLEEETGVVKKR